MIEELATPEHAARVTHYRLGKRKLWRWRCDCGATGEGFQTADGAGSGMLSHFGEDGGAS